MEDTVLTVRLLDRRPWEDAVAAICAAASSVRTAAVNVWVETWFPAVKEGGAAQ